jgi:hypothetical protein
MTDRYWGDERDPFRPATVPPGTVEPDLPDRDALDERNALDALHQPDDEE